MTGSFAAAPPDESPQEAGQFLAGILGQGTAGEWPAADVRDDDGTSEIAPDDKQNEEWA